MRRRRQLSLALAMTVVGSGLVLPVISFPAASPHPVAPRIHRLLVHGVDTSALRGAPKGLLANGRVTRPAVLTAPRSASSFSTIGVTWRSGSAAESTVVQARVRADGLWSPWGELEQSDAPAAGSADSPDAHSAGPVRRDGTEPSYVGPSDGYQVQVSSPSGRSPVDVQVVAVDPGSSPADATTGTNAGQPAASAAAEANRPTVLSRAAWGANESLRNCAPTIMSTVKATVVHHTDSGNGYSSSAVPALIRGVYAYHTKALGWCDIAYNVLVDRFGRLWEGRFGGLDRPVMSAATGGFNNYTSAISAVGNFDTAAAPAKMVDAIARFVSWKLGLYRINPSARTSLVSGGGSFTKYRTGTVVPLRTVFGHRDSDQTACPGRYLYGQLASIRAKAYAYAGPSLFSPTLNYNVLSIHDVHSVMINAGTRGAQKWRLTVYQVGATAHVWSGTGSSVGSRISAIWPRTRTAGQPVGAGSFGLILTSSTARTWIGRVTIVGDPVISPGDPKPALATVYTTPGSTISAGHAWTTTRGSSSVQGPRRCRDCLLVIAAQERSGRVVQVGPVDQSVIWLGDGK